MFNVHSKLMNDTKPVNGGYNEIEPLAKMRIKKMRERERKTHIPTASPEKPYK